MENIKLTAYRSAIIALVVINFCFACNMEKDVEIPLPPYERQLVVEAYLVPNEPFKLLLTETESYFESVKVPLVEDALVTIRYNNITDTLKYNISFDTLATKIYNYTASSLVPSSPGETEYILNIQDTKGRKVSASTSFLPVVKIDTVEINYREDSLANLLVKFKDDADAENYYRLVINKGTAYTAASTDYSINDRLLNGMQIPLGTRFAFEKGDTVQVRLYHIDKKYYDYLESIENASNANGNPFAQPASIKSGVNGGIGIFTSLSYDQWSIIIR